MSVAIAARFAARELRGGLRGFWVFLACLSLGVAAIAAVGSVRAAIEAGLAREGATLLGGDVEMEFTYRFATPDERAWMERHAQHLSEVTDFRSMAVVTRDGQSERALTQVKSVDGAYPLLGQIGLEPAIPLDQALAGQNGLPGGVMAPILADRLGLTVGDTFALGGSQFVLSAILTREPDNAGGGFGFGPRTLVATSALAGTGLLAPGTLFSTEYRLVLPPDADLDALQAEALAAFENAGLRWRDARNGAPGVARFVDRLGAFLILVGLSGLAVGGVGVSAAVRAYLARKTTVIATLRSLGAERRMIFQTYMLQIGALSLVGITLGLALGGLVPLALAPLITAQLPVPAVFALHPAPLIEAAIYGTLTAVLFTLWPLARTEDIRAATLFRDGSNAASPLPRPVFLATTLALLALLVAAAGWFSGNWPLTLWTAAGLLASLAVLALAAIALRKLAAHSRSASRTPTLRWALGAIATRRDEATSVVLSLGLGLTVLAAVGQIDGTLRGAIARDLPDVAPSYFFLDIQRDQMPAITQQLESDPDVTRIDSAPMLRGVVTRINDRPALEVAGEHWVVRGDRGISYADALPAGTKIVAGQWWLQGYQGAPQISFAEEEATELGVGLGDTITVNILGREITATITSLRAVDFSNAGMGFVIVMNEAALASAPHSFIATVYAAPTAEARILRAVSNAYPNITAINVREAITQVSTVLDGIAAATRWGAAATLLTGFLVLIGAAAAGEPARRYEAAVLRSLGATRQQILASFALRAALLGLGAAVVALGAGIAGGWAISHFVLDTRYSVVWPSAIAILAGGVLATLGAGMAFAWRPLAARPAAVLRARE